MKRFKSGIQYQDISIVVQGPILGPSSYDITKETTKVVCQRVRKLFPQSEIILSTYEGSNVEGIDYDVLVLSPDPGAASFIYREEKALHNINRMIVSTFNGVKAATRKYVLRLRSDLFVISKSFLNYFDQFPHYNNDLKVVKSRIIAFSIHSLRRERGSGMEVHRPFHISDWAYFGYREDLYNLYDVDQVPEPEFSQWYLTHIKHFHDLFPARLWKMSPEEYITSSFFKKHFPEIRYEHTVDVSHGNIEQSERLIANNFLVLDQTQFCLISLKLMELHITFDVPQIFDTALLYHSWLKDYYKHSHVPIVEHRLQHKIQIYWRPWRYRLLNAILKNLNGHSQRLKRVVAYYIKKTL